MPNELVKVKASLKKIHKNPRRKTNAGKAEKLPSGLSLQAKYKLEEMVQWIMCRRLSRNPRFKARIGTMFLSSRIIF